MNRRTKIVQENFKHRRKVQQQHWEISVSSSRCFSGQSYCQEIQFYSTAFNADFFKMHKNFAVGSGKLVCCKVWLGKHWVVHRAKHWVWTREQFIKWDFYVDSRVSSHSAPHFVWKVIDFREAKPSHIQPTTMAIMSLGRLLDFLSPSIFICASNWAASRWRKTFSFHDTFERQRQTAPDCRQKLFLLLLLLLDLSSVPGARIPLLSVEICELVAATRQSMIQHEFVMRFPLPQAPLSLST